MFVTPKVVFRFDDLIDRAPHPLIQLFRQNHQGGATSASIIR
jgi:hypothetical protein